MTFRDSFQFKQFYDSMKKKRTITVYHYLILHNIYMLLLKRYIADACFCTIVRGCAECKSFPDVGGLYDRTMMGVGYIMLI